MARPTRSASLRRYVGICKADNRREGQRTKMSGVEKAVRNRLLIEHPDLDDAEIDRRVARIMAHGSRPTTDTTQKMRDRAARQARQAATPDGK